ncbi:fatty acid desaturase family protein [Marinobacter goseongensis]|uniref:fatty acid desaturase family protein n=1 Tax=Marinobacter goseongensis TaxID=453838 RepID=UPI002006CAC9|nr:acyl-CoA desaturase [Marinobacter goseongensis]MCK7551072.1 acyl-CoA desaturase [Marinobacter goseongensis]
MKQMTEAQLSVLEQDLNAIRDEVIADLGERDANYIRRVVRLHRALEVGGRVMMPFGFIPPVFVAATVALGISKIIENMEIGHNVMHGQYDWMNDPSLHSQSYEWDTACDSDSWRLTHNYEHHTYTNIIGKDRDYGYALLRLSDDEKWRPAHSLQFVNYVLLSVFFQWGVALHEMEFERVRRGEVTLREKLPFLKGFLRKGGRQAFKDYAFFPLLTFPVAPIVLAGNLGANLIRNLWSSTVIFCGHFTQDAETFSEEECEGESKGHWYLRQLTGSSNFSGNKFVHLLSGHLSYQMEHHVFPDLPAHRYPEISEKVQAVCKKHGIHYNTGSFAKQYGTVLKRIVSYSLPDRVRQRIAPQMA